MKRKIIKLLFAFVMTLLLLVLSISFGLGIGVFNSRNIIKSIDQSDYYNKAYNAINKKTESLLSEVGYSKDLLSDVITQDRVYVDGMNYVNAILNNKSQKNLDIYEDIVSHITNNQSIQTDEVSTDIHQFASAIEYEYRSKIELKFVEYLISCKADYKKLMIILIPSILLLTALFSYMLIRIHKYKHRGIRYIAYAMIASSVLVLFTAAYLLLSKQYIDPTIIPDYYNQFISEYIRMCIIVYLYLGVLGIVGFLGLITLIGHMRNKIVYRI